MGLAPLKDNCGFRCYIIDGLWIQIPWNRGLWDNIKLIAWEWSIYDVYEMYDLRLKILWRTDNLDVIIMKGIILI